MEDKSQEEIPIIDLLNVLKKRFFVIDNYFYWYDMF